MKITKAMGRACLRELETGVESSFSTLALSELAGGGWALDDEQLKTALSMCAAIAESEGD